MSSLSPEELKRLKDNLVHGNHMKLDDDLKREGRMHIDRAMKLEMGKHCHEVKVLGDIIPYGLAQQVWQNEQDRIEKTRCKVAEYNRGRSKRTLLKK